MTTTTLAKKPDAPIARTPQQEFAARVTRTAERQMAAIMGSERGQAAAHAITMSIMGAMQSAKDPSAFHKVTDLSLANCVALSHATELYPGGPNPAVYLVPQSPRKGAQPELQWRITHRGLARLANEAGFSIQAVPVTVRDEIVVSFGDLERHIADPDDWPDSMKDLRGIAVVVRRLEDGLVLCRAWMPRKAIEKRRDVARDKSVWDKWPVEQSQKTAIKWAFARGLAPIASEKLSRAVQADDLAEGFGPGRKSVDNEAMLPEPGRRSFTTSGGKLEPTPEEWRASVAAAESALGVSGSSAEPRTIADVNAELQRQRDEKGQQSVGEQRFEELVKLVLHSGVTDLDDAYAAVNIWLDEEESGRNKLLESKIKPNWKKLYAEAEVFWPAAEGVGA